MGYMKERTAYLRGLADGIELGEDKYGKLLRAMIDCMDEMGGSIDENEEAILGLEESLDEIYDDLEDLDAFLFEEDEDDEDDEDGASDFYEIECASCGETIYFDADMLENNEELLCPNCNAGIELSVPGEEGEE